MKRRVLAETDRERETEGVEFWPRCSNKWFSCGWVFLREAGQPQDYVQEWTPQNKITYRSGHHKTRLRTGVDTTKQDYVQEWTPQNKITYRSGHHKTRLRTGVDTTKQDYVQEWTPQNKITYRSGHHKTRLRTGVDTTKQDYVQEWTPQNKFGYVVVRNQQIWMITNCKQTTQHMAAVLSIAILLSTPNASACPICHSWLVWHGLNFSPLSD